MTSQDSGVKKIPQVRPEPHPDPHAVQIRKVRVSKEHAAFVYAILESYEGAVSYSTLPSDTGEVHRDLKLVIPVSFIQQVDAILKELGDIIYELN